MHGQSPARHAVSKRSQAVFDKLGFGERQDIKPRCGVPAHTIPSVSQMIRIKSSLRATRRLEQPSRLAISSLL